MSIAVITMVHNEDHMLDLWCSHYSKLDNCTLFIVDHGSDLPLEPHVRERATIVKLPRKGVDEHIERTRALFISAMQNAFITYFDVVIYTDADEFIVVDPKLGEPLHSYIERQSAPVIAPIGLNVVHDSATEPAFDWSVPVFQQRATAVFVEHFCKPVITRQPIQWGSGFHTSKSPVFLDESLFLFHLNLFDYDCKLRRQRERECIAQAAGRNIATWGWGEKEISRQFQNFLNVPRVRPEENFDFGKEAQDFRRDSKPGADGFYFNGQRRGRTKHTIPSRFSNSV